jgi:hypothetical protein
LARYFFWRVILVLLLAISRKMRVWVWFFGGENVVECVVNVVFWQSLFRREKCARFLGFIFRDSRFGLVGVVCRGAKSVRAVARMPTSQSRDMGHPMQWKTDCLPVFLSNSSSG